RCDIGSEAEAQRAAIREAIAFKKYEFDAHGVEMNQRYSSDAAVTDGQLEPDFELDADLHYQPTTWPGARIPHVWVFDRAGDKHSTLDLCGKGRFALFTGIGGEGWRDAEETLSAELGLDIDLRVIGPRQDWLDHTGDWARAREIGDTGCLLVRPDQHVAWRVEALPKDPAAELRRVLRQILGHDTVAKTAAAREMADA
ncbi:MAG: 2,4-dichlorophenol 6-monooxygenase, partial [Pseudomonadota bacterium]